MDRPDIAREALFVSDADVARMCRMTAAEWDVARVDSLNARNSTVTQHGNSTVTADADAHQQVIEK